MANEEADLPFGMCKFDSDFLRSFHSTLKDLRSLTISNIEFYQRGRSSIHARYYATSCILLERTQVLEPVVIDIVPKLKDFDFSPEIQANGYRSFISIVYRCCLHLLQLCRHIYTNKNSLLFRSSHYLKELEAYVETSGQLIACLGYLQQLISHSCHGNLFLDDNPEVGDELLLEVEMLNTDCFYGRCLGFQFCESMQKVLQVVLVALATFSECYEESSQVIQLASSILNGSKYVVDQELRAKQVVDVTRTADIKFCKAFWSIPESSMLHQIRLFTFSHVEVSELMSIPPENFELPQEGSTSDETVMITPPCAHSGPAPVTVRLISHTLREGMEVTRKRFQRKTGSSKAAVLPKSPCLLFHCHGGGFVAQSSQAHENYLRVWARQLEVPILSVDYSLAPDAPFPRALEECFYAYAWALKNHDKIGWTGERVCFAGDSAGGNLVVSTALRAISYQIRLPDGIMAAYTPFLVQYKPSPARLMSMIDPLLPVGILTRCLAAYAGIADKFSSALTKPIFCNPGNYESWEMVDEQDVQQEAIGNGVTNGINAYQTSMQMDNATCPCKHCCTSDGACNMSDLTDSDDGESQSPTHVIDNTAGFPGCSKCESIEELHERNNNDVLTSGDSVLGTIDVDKDETKDKLEKVIQVDRNDISESCENYSSKETSFIEQDDTCLKEPEPLEKVNDDNQAVTVVRTEPESNEQKLKDECDKETLEKRNRVHDVDTIDAQSVSEAISKIDSGVKIEVDDTSVEGETVDNQSGMAACQEILEEQKHATLSLYPDLGLSKDMNGTSCHSIPDLLMNECNENVENPDKKLTIDEEENNSGVGKSEIEKGATADKLLRFSDVHKQGSVSDNSDSGIHGDMTEDIPSGSAISNDTYNQTKAQSSVKQDNEAKIDSKSQSDEPDNLPEHIESSEKKEESKDDDHHLQGSRANRLSLGLSVRYHPGTAESPERISHVSPHKSPVSPKLPTGSRSFAPKMYSVHRKIAQSPIQLFRQLPIVKNFYMSPILAPDDLLSLMPEVHLVACHFDPLLDDSIMFAKKLSDLGKSVSLHVFDHLPHGFLSFSDASPEAKTASNFCLKKIKDVLKLPNDAEKKQEK